jgi:dihydroorotase
VDIFDREKVFLDTILMPLVQRLPQLHVVLEHITTADAAAFVQEAPANVGATITAHHLLFNRNHMLVGGVRPHYFCLPILKRRTHQEALIAAATSGSPKFFLGTDSAPHTKGAKEMPVAVLAPIPPTPPLSYMPRPSRLPAHWTSSKALPAFMGPTFTACPVIPTPSPW